LEGATVKDGGSHWCNQVPVASGLVDPAIDKRAAIDLVRQRGKDSYELIELKIESNNPLFAAIEILLYGLVFVWSKTYWEELGCDLKKKPMLNASSVTLMVLAPSRFYKDFDLSHLRESLNERLSSFGEIHGVELAFRFCQFPESFVKNVTEYEDSIHPVWDASST
jgi:hypothetical protein